MNWNLRCTVLAICIVLAGLTWFVFGQTLGFEFVNYDDYDYVVKNPRVTAGLTSGGIAWAFTHVHSSNWHPLTWISHMLDCQFYGLAPRGHHLTNVILHTCTVILLFLVLRRMTNALWRSAFVAAVFAIHPLRVESVAWIAERKDVLSALFFVLTIGAYARYAARPSRGRYMLVLISFALGLMAKPMLVTLPFVLLLLDYWPLQRWPNESNQNDRQVVRKLLLEKLPLLLLAAASAAITLFAQKGAIQPVAYVSLPMRIPNALVSCILYLRQMFWPSDLAVFYPLAPEAITLTTMVFALALLTGISFACFRATKWRYFRTGWLWYLVMLAPVIGIVQVGLQAHADRYTYLPQIGLYLLVTWAACDLLDRWRYRQSFLSALGATIIATLAVCARSQAAYWKDSETLWKMTIARTPPNGLAHLNLGESLYEKGELGEAIDQYGIALQSKVVEAQAHSALGVVLLDAGQPQQSITHLESALALSPNYAEAHYNLGNSFLQTGQDEQAIEQYTKALDLNAQDVEALNNLARLLATSPEAAVRDGHRASELAERADAITAGKSPIISATLAAAYAESGRFAEAIKTAKRAAELAEAEGNAVRANSIHVQLEAYQAGSAVRDKR